MAFLAFQNAAAAAARHMETLESGESRPPVYTECVYTCGQVHVRPQAPASHLHTWMASFCSLSICFQIMMSLAAAPGGVDGNPWDTSTGCQVRSSDFGFPVRCCCCYFYRDCRFITSAPLCLPHSRTVLPVSPERERGRFFPLISLSLCHRVLQSDSSSCTLASAAALSLG